MSRVNVSSGGRCHSIRVAQTCSLELNQLTGIAAILTFPLDVEVVEAEERDAKEEEIRRKLQESGEDVAQMT